MEVEGKEAIPSLSSTTICNIHISHDRTLSISSQSEGGPANHRRSASFLFYSDLRSHRTHASLRLSPYSCIFPTPDEAAVYDRQIRLWGLEAQNRYASSPPACPVSLASSADFILSSLGLDQDARLYNPHHQPEISCCRDDQEPRAGWNWETHRVCTRWTRLKEMTES